MRRPLLTILLLLLSLYPAPALGQSPELMARIHAAIEALDMQFRADQQTIARLGDELTISHHTFTGRIDPQAGTYSGTATSDVRTKLETRQLNLLLHAGFVVSAIVVESGGQRLETSFESHRFRSDELLENFLITFTEAELPDELNPDDLRGQGLHLQQLSIRLPRFSQAGQEYQVSVSYAGSYSLLDMEPFTGEAVYLNGANFWFPDVYGPISTFELTLEVPQDWHVWSQGKFLGETIKDGWRTARYKAEVRQGQIVVIAGPYQVERETRGGVEFASFLFPETAMKIADQPLMAKAEEYVEFFGGLVGPYPYESFAVIETNAHVGEGYPAFTLLGGHVINAHFLDPYSLGHEILHCWFGNWVHWGGEGGNWTEGLTYYLANLYYDEVQQGPEYARLARKKALEELSYAYRWAREEMPAINEFVTNHDPRYDAGGNQAVGYNQLGLLVHSWRRWLGDAAFFRMLQQFVREYGGKSASLADLTRLLFDALAAQGKARGEREAWVQQYMNTWYDQRGIPVFELEYYSMVPGAAGHDVSATVQIQHHTGGPRPPVQVRVGTAEGAVLHESWLASGAGHVDARLVVPGAAAWIEFDPDYDLLRWIPDAEKAPSLDHLRKAGRTAIVLAEHDFQVLAEGGVVPPLILAGPAQQILLRPEEADAESVQGHNLLLIGLAGEDDWMDALLPQGPSRELGEFDAVYRLIKDPASPAQCIGVALGKDHEALAGLVRRLSFYPMQSELGLKDGKIAHQARSESETSSLRAWLTGAE